MIEGIFTPNTYTMARIKLEENIWISRTGVHDFNKCIKDNDDGKCTSLFSVKLNENKNR